MLSYSFERNLPISDTGAFDEIVKQTFAEHGVTGTSGKHEDEIWFITVHSTTELNQDIIDGLNDLITNTEDFVMPESSEPTQEDDINALLIDHEYRLVLLELGVM